MSDGLLDRIRQDLERPRPPLPVFQAIVATLSVLVAAALIFWTVLSRLLVREWPWQDNGATTSQADALRLALALVAGAGGAVALVVAFRRQRLLELDEQGRRDQTRLLTERFGAAAAQLGGDAAAVRLAGVYAMAALADEWEEQRQQCVDVLCGYLRLPYGGDTPPRHPTTVTTQRLTADGRQQRTETTTYRSGEAEVRRAVVDTLTRHLRDGAQVSWSDLDFNLRGAHLVDAAFADAIFGGGTTDFSEATFTGRTSFVGAVFNGDFATFEDAAFTGRTHMLNHAEFRARTMTFQNAIFGGFITNLDGATFGGNKIYASSARFVSRFTWFTNTTFSADWFLFHATVFAGETVSFDGANVTDTAGFDHALFPLWENVAWGPISARCPHPPITDDDLAELSDTSVRLR